MSTHPVLNDSSFTDEINIKIPQWKLEAEQSLDGKGDQWAFLKHKIGEFSREYGAKVQKAKNLLKANLETELKELAGNLDPQNKERYLDLQAQLNDIIDNEIKGSILRCICKDYQEGEKCTKYFFSLEKFRGKQKTLSRVKKSNGTFTYDDKEILAECRSFYEKLFSANEGVDCNNPEYDFFFNNENIPKVSDANKINCDKSITEEELFENLKQFGKNKAPGLDGLSAEFYLKFWEQLKGNLLEVYEEAFQNGILPLSLRTGLIVLLEKKDKDRSFIENWRPITLLNLDYKLLTKTLASRLKIAFGDVINEDQNAYVKEGNIFFSSHTIRDILFYCQKEHLDLIMMGVDYTKAFDSVNFQCLHKTFETFGFGETFRQWIKLIYNDGKSCITNNGHISEKFTLYRSCRQGDPISQLCFILVLQLLFIVIRGDPNIRGVKILNNEIKITAYADDASYFLRDRPSAELMSLIHISETTRLLSIS